MKNSSFIQVKVGEFLQEKNRNNKLGKSQWVFSCLQYQSVQWGALTLPFNYKDFSRSNQSILFKFFPLNFKKNWNKHKVSTVAKLLNWMLGYCILVLQTRSFRILNREYKYLPRYLDIFEIGVNSFFQVL